MTHTKAPTVTELLARGLWLECPMCFVRRDVAVHPDCPCRHLPDWQRPYAHLPTLDARAEAWLSDRGAFERAGKPDDAA